MRVVRFYAPRDVRVEDAPEPAAGPGELLVRVRNCSICGTDAKIWGSGHPDLRPPRVLGHEVAGEVVDVGQGAAHRTGQGIAPRKGHLQVQSLMATSSPDAAAGWRASMRRVRAERAVAEA